MTIEEPMHAIKISFLNNAIELTSYFFEYFDDKILMEGDHEVIQKTNNFFIGEFLLDFLEVNFNSKSSSLDFFHKYGFSCCVYNENQNKEIYEVIELGTVYFQEEINYIMENSIKKTEEKIYFSPGRN